MSKLMTHNLERYRMLPLISVNAANGVAVCGGAELLSMGDFRFISNSCIIRYLHAKIGIVPGWGGKNAFVWYINYM
jgi:ethylmalonyl-CoA/methylmalonyl-CoA decarboxylase